MAVRRVNFGFWLLRVLTWDTLLPACVVLLPTVIEILIPNNRVAIEVTAVALPIIGFFVRLGAGRRQIASNNCGVAFRRFQSCVFCVGIFPLVLADSFLILSHLLPQGALFAHRTDCVLWVILVSIYLASMSVAMYPGATEPVS